MARFFTGHHIWENLFTLLFEKVARKKVIKTMKFDEDWVREQGHLIFANFWKTWFGLRLFVPRRGLRNSLNFTFRKFQNFSWFHERFRRLIDNSTLFWKSWTGTIERQIQVFFWKNREKSDFRVVASRKKTWFLLVQKMICLILGSWSVQKSIQNCLDIVLCFF